MELNYNGRSGIKRSVIIAVLLLVGFCVYINALHGAFIWDDEEQIVNNTVIRSWDNLPLILKSGTFYSGGAGLYGSFYRPLVSLSYFLNYSVWGLNTLGFHLFQVLFHLANIALVFLLVEEILKSQKISYGRTAAALTALFFAVHPANVESVAYIGSVGEVMFGFFSLLGIFIFIKGVNGSADSLDELGTRSPQGGSANPPSSPQSRWSALAATLAICCSFALIFLGLLAKEAAIVALPILLLYLVLFARPVSLRSQRVDVLQETGPEIYSPRDSNRGVRRVDGAAGTKWRAYAVFFFGSAVVAGVYAFLRFAVSKVAVVRINLSPIASAPLVERLQTIPYTLISYFKVIFFPRDLSVSRHFVVHLASDPRFWGAIIFLAVCAVAAVKFCIWKKPNWKISAFFLLWFFIAIVPTLNIVPLYMTVAERWLYFPAIGIIAATSVFIAPIIMRQRGICRCVAWGVVFLVFAALAARTAVRNSDWKNGLALFSHDAKIESRVSPDGSFDLENNYGVEMFRAGMQGSAEHFEKSVSLQPNWSISRNNLGAALENQGDLDGALSQYRRAIELADYYLAYENAGKILIKMKLYGEAKEFLENALRKFPGNDELRFWLAALYAADGVTQEKDGKQKAAELLSAILYRDPNNERVRRFILLLESGQKVGL